MPGNQLSMWWLLVLFGLAFLVAGLIHSTRHARLRRRRRRNNARIISRSNRPSVKFSVKGPRRK